MRAHDSSCVHRGRRSGNDGSESGTLFGQPVALLLLRGGFGFGPAALFPPSAWPPGMHPGASPNVMRSMNKQGGDLRRPTYRVSRLQLSASSLEKGGGARRWGAGVVLPAGLLGSAEARTLRVEQLGVRRKRRRRGARAGRRNRGGRQTGRREADLRGHPLFKFSTCSV